MAMIGNDVGAGAAAPTALGSGKVSSQGATGSRSGRRGGGGAFDALMSNLAQEQPPDASQSSNAKAASSAPSGSGLDSKVSPQPDPHASIAGTGTLRSRQLASERAGRDNRESLVGANGEVEAQVSAAETEIGSGGQRHRGTVGDGHHDWPIDHLESSDVAIWPDTAVMKVQLPIAVQVLSLDGAAVEAEGVETGGPFVPADGRDAIAGGTLSDGTPGVVLAEDAAATASNPASAGKAMSGSASFDAANSVVEEAVSPEQLHASLQAGLRTASRGTSPPSVDAAPTQTRRLAPASDDAKADRPTSQATSAMAATRLAVLSELRRALAAIAHEGVDSVASRGDSAQSRDTAQTLPPFVGAGDSSEGGVGESELLVADLPPALSDGGRAVEQGDVATSLPVSSRLDTGMAEKSESRVAVGVRQPAGKRYDLSESAAQMRGDRPAETAPGLSSAGAVVQPDNSQFGLTDTIATANTAPATGALADAPVSDAPLDTAASKVPALVTSAVTAAKDSLPVSANGADRHGSQADAAAAQAADSQPAASAVPVGSATATEQPRHLEPQPRLEGHQAARARGRLKPGSAATADGLDSRHGEKVSAVVTNVAKSEPESPESPPISTTSEGNTGSGRVATSSPAGSRQSAESTPVFGADADAASLAIADATAGRPGSRPVRSDATSSVTNETAPRPSAHVARALAAFHAASLGAPATADSSSAVRSVPGAAFEAALAPEVHAQLVDAVRLKADQGGGQARITLNPTFLGELEIDVRIAGNSVVASVHASNSDVREWIRTNESALRQSLADQGLSLNQFVVFDDEADTGQSRGEGDSRGQDDTQQTWQRRRRQAPEHSTFEVVL